MPTSAFGAVRCLSVIPTSLVPNPTAPNFAGSVTLPALSPVLAIGEMLILHLGTFGGSIQSSFTVTDNGSGGWEPLIPFAQVTGSQTYNVWTKVAEASDVAQATAGTWQFTYGCTASSVAGIAMWGQLDCLGGAIGIPQIDPNWASTGITTITTTGAQYRTGNPAATPPTGQCPVAFGTSHQAIEVIYAGGFQGRSIAPGPNTPAFPSNNHAAFPDLAPLAGGTVLGANGSHLNTGWATSLEQFTPNGGANPATLYESWGDSRVPPDNGAAGFTFAVAFYDPGVAFANPSGARVRSFPGRPRINLGFAPTGAFALAGSFVTEGGTDGATVAAYRSYRFTTAPVQDTALPPGGGDQIGAPVTTNETYGAPGAWTLDVPVVDDYYVVVTYPTSGAGVHRYWRLYPAGMVSGRVISDFVINGDAGAIGPVVLDTPTPGTTGTAADAGHTHPVGPLYGARGEILIGAGDGVAELRSLGDEGTIFTSDGSTGVWLPPSGGVGVSFIREPTAPGTPTVTYPGEYLVDGSAGQYDIQLPPITSTSSPTPGYYSFKRLDDTNNFVRFLPADGQTIDGAAQWGFMHQDDVCVLVPDGVGSWIVHQQPDVLGYMYANSGFIHAFGYTGGGSAGSGTQAHCSPGPYTGASLLSVNGSGSAWQAILTVSQAGFEFWGTDVNDGNTPTVSGISGMSGTAQIMAVGPLDDGTLTNPNNIPPGIVDPPAGYPTSPWMSGAGYPAPRNLAPNEALVQFTSGPVLTGAGQIAFNNRRSPIDSQDSSGTPLTEQDGWTPGTYAFCSLVVPPSGVFEAICSGSGKMFFSGVPKGISWPLAICFDTQNKQQTWNVKASTAKVMVAAQFTVPGNSGGNQITASGQPFTGYTQPNYEEHIVQHPVQSIIIQNNQGMLAQALPPGHPAWLYWIVWPVATGGQSNYGDGTGWFMENLPWRLVARGVPGGTEVAGSTGYPN